MIYRSVQKLLDNLSDEISKLDLSSTREVKLLESDEGDPNCSNCGATVPVYSKYCLECGSRFSNKVTELDSDKLPIKEFEEFTKQKYNSNNIFLFRFELINNDLDDDNECFSYYAMVDMTTKFVGSTGLLSDHKNNTVQARIFKTELHLDKTRKTKYTDQYYYINAWAYLVRNKENESLVNEIKYGILNKASISCWIKRKICSVCGCNRLECSCSCKNNYLILSEIIDAYEWSLIKPALLKKTIKGVKK